MHSNLDLGDTHSNLDLGDMHRDQQPELTARDTVAQVCTIRSEQNVIKLQVIFFNGIGDKKTVYDQ